MTDRISYTHTLMIVIGLVLVVAGAVCALFGVGGSSTFSGKIAGVELTTTSVGLAVTAIGAIEAAYIATHLPPGTRVFSDSAGARTRLIRRRALMLTATGAVALFLAALSILLANT